MPPARGRLSKRAICPDLKRIIIVICPNIENHGEHLFIRIIFWKFGYSLDEPNYQEVMDIVEETQLGYDGWEIVEALCYDCRNGYPSHSH